MIVCDECRDVRAKGFDCAIVVEKQDNPPREMGRRVKRKKPREVCKIPLVLCDKCLSKVLKNLGRLKARGELGGHKLETPSGSLASVEGEENGSDDQ